jgi:hypothetical protein
MAELSLRLQLQAICACTRRASLLTQRGNCSCTLLRTAIRQGVLGVHYFTRLLSELVGPYVACLRWWEGLATVEQRSATTALRPAALNCALCDTIHTHPAKPHCKRELAAVSASASCSIAASGSAWSGYVDPQGGEEEGEEERRRRPVPCSAVYQEQAQGGHRCAA